MSNREYTEGELAMARDTARDHVDLAGRIYDGIIGMHDLSTVRRYADRYGVEAPHGLTEAMRAVVAERRIIVHWDVCFESVPTPEALEALFDEDRIMLNPAGTRGVAYWLGPGDAENHSRPLEEKVLRVDLDPATGAGAARWQGGLVAVEPGYTATPFGVWGENEFEAVPIGVARVSYATARRIAVEYVKHGSRPEWLSWAQGHSTTSYLREEFEERKERHGDAPFRITQATLDVLESLFYANEELYGRQICEDTGRKSGAVNPILRRLEQYEWVDARWETDTERSTGSRRRYYRLDPSRVASVRDILVARERITGDQEATSLLTGSSSSNERNSVEHTIRISEEVYQALVKRIAEFDDTPDTVLRRLLGIDLPKGLEVGTDGKLNVSITTDPYYDHQSGQ